MENEPTAAAIWQTLSSLDCSEHVEKKGNLSYLSWAWAWGTMMEHYPMLQLEWEQTHYEPNGTASVGVSGDIGGVRRYMWLPVMDNRNKAIANPTSRDISDARMRCMVKLFALYGLAHYLYAGEDIPKSEGNRPAHDSPRVSEYQVREMESLIDEVGADRAKFLKWLRVDDLGDLPAASYGRAINALNKKRETATEEAA